MRLNGGRYETAKKLMEILDLGSWDSGCLISKDGKG